MELKKLQGWSYPQLCACGCGMVIARGEQSLLGFRNDTRSNGLDWNSLDEFFCAYRAECLTLTREPRVAIKNETLDALKQQMLELLRTDPKMLHDLYVFMHGPLGQRI